ncbi:uncharacterized protein RHOBADRAFT_50852 [Rhodotorula graminis WP1]|uniref:Uncharacterized protein n=1 Tax=Rhodotorula graminis (strain WP1) TaxID=578459 RepID=A0A194SCN8_RHOGW|nr:uncharacterized protein RHOBADRAFT_50852 [Rhodotorula graminis WP1]KPV78379.1 hypothetical protein RHOBADRAFT_50852 [Rhodotorula graminis WP1]
MADSNPPQYSAAATATVPQVLVNLAPSTDSDTASFQLGFLGHGPAYVAGEVQVKYTGIGDVDARPAFRRLDVCLRGVERGANPHDEPIELFDQRQVLWGDGAAGTSSAGAATTSGEASFPPSVNSFKLELTSDLPVCVHAPPSSSLAYTLTATLYPADPDALPLVRCHPVHLVRTSPPGSLPAGTSSPRTVSATSPLAFSVRLPRTSFRRSEPIELTTRIEVPDAKAVGEGLRLRTVSAELVRTITGIAVSPSRAPSADDDEGRLELEPQVHRTVLAHSGKSARFSPSRPIIIRLVLHPPTEPSCESITQSSILHTVSFAVVVTIGLVSARPSSSTRAASPLPDAVLSQDVVILPDSPPASRSDKQKEVDREQYTAAPPPPVDAPWASQDAPVPTYVERSEHDLGEPPASGSSTSAWSSSLHHDFGASPSSSSSAGILVDMPYAVVYPTDGDEDEYDGYEELSLPATLSTRLPPPAIDEDVSPPSVGEPSSVAGLALAAAMGGLIDERDEDGADEGETPPPDDFAAYTASSSPPPPLSPRAGEREEGAPPPSFEARPSRELPPLLPHPHSDPPTEPASPPPHIDFHPLPPPVPLPLPVGVPSTPPEHLAASTTAEDDLPPPVSPAGLTRRGLPPPYFGGSPPPPHSGPLTPPPPPPPGALGTVAHDEPHPAGRALDSSAPVRGAVGERDGQVDEGLELDGRPPPYEQRDAALAATRGRAGDESGRMGELVL